MFKDTHVTQLTAWSVLEESDVFPSVLFPAFIGSGQLGFGLDAGGLQGMPDRLCAHYGCSARPWHVTQADLYVLREGMISSHLWDDEIAYAGFDPADDYMPRHGHRNFLPLGYLTQSFILHGEEISGDELRAKCCKWRREWNLLAAVVRTSFSFDRRFRSFEQDPLRVTIEAFSPHGSESLYLKLERGAARPGDVDDEFTWVVNLPFTTRHDLPIFDQPDAVTPGKRTILATIDDGSRYQPAEAYAVLYGAAADGMEVHVGAQGWTLTMRGTVAQAQTAWVRLDFRRFASEELANVDEARALLETQLSSFRREDYATALLAHEREYAAFWARTADIAVEGADELDTRRRFMLHMSEYLLRCGNDQTLGGTVQFLLFHQNGWSASNFHDHHYIIDGVARANLWQEAEGHARWMHAVMRPQGRPFPWMLTYDGAAPIPPDRDRAPMSDANRALLAMRIYELAGRGRESLLRDTVYPILRAVADHALAEWFVAGDEGFILRGVENDVMAETPRRHEMGTVIMFLTVLRKAIDYSARLDIDSERRTRWQTLVDNIPLPAAEGRYLSYWDADPASGSSTWFNLGFYIAEAQEYLDRALYTANRDAFERMTSCNFAWLNSAAASSEIRLGRADRAEQFMLDTLVHRIHGPGYFEECAPIFLAALPPFGTAHGAYVTAACEQIVLPDFWRPRVYIGRGMPAKMRAAHVNFSGLRALGGLLIGGESTPSHLRLSLHHTGDPLAIELVLRVPSEACVHFRLLKDGEPCDYQFHGDSVSLTVSLQYDERVELLLQG